MAKLDMYHEHNLIHPVVYGDEDMDLQRRDRAENTACMIALIVCVPFFIAAAFYGLHDFAAYIKSGVGHMTTLADIFSTSPIAGGHHSGLMTALSFMPACIVFFLLAAFLPFAVLKVLFRLMK